MMYYYNRAPVGLGLRKTAALGAVISIGAKVLPHAVKFGRLALNGAKFAGKAVGQAGKQFATAGRAIKAGNVGTAAKSAWQGTKTTINAGEHALRPITNQINGAANTLINRGGFANKTVGYGLKGVNEFGVKMMTPKNMAIGYGLDKGLEAGLNAAGLGAVEEAAQQIPQQAGNMVRRAPTRTAYSMIRKGVNNVPR